MPDVPSRAAVSHIGCRVPKWEPVFTDSAKWSDFYKEMVLSVSGSLNSRFSRGRHPILCFLKHIIYRHGSLRSLHPVCSNAWSLLRVFCPGKGWNCEHHARGVHGSRYKQSRTGFMHGYLQSSVLGNKFCMPFLPCMKDTIAGYKDTCMVYLLYLSRVCHVFRN